MAVTFFSHFKDVILLFSGFHHFFREVACHFCCALLLRFFSILLVFQQFDYDVSVCVSLCIVNLGFAELLESVG